MTEQDIIKAQNLSEGIIKMGQMSNIENHLRTTQVILDRLDDTLQTDKAKDIQFRNNKSCIL